MASEFTEDQKKEIDLMIRKAVDAAIIQMRQEIINAKKAVFDELAAKEKNDKMRKG